MCETGSSLRVRTPPPSRGGVTDEQTTRCRRERDAQLVVRVVRACRSRDGVPALPRRVREHSAGGGLRCSTFQNSRTSGLRSICCPARPGPTATTTHSKIASWGSRIIVFEVPDTLITNDPDLVREFWSRHKRVIYMSISSVHSIVKEVTNRTGADWTRSCGVRRKFERSFKDSISGFTR